MTFPILTYLSRLMNSDHYNEQYQLLRWLQESKWAYHRVADLDIREVMLDLYQIDKDAMAEEGRMLRELRPDLFEKDEDE